MGPSNKEIKISALKRILQDRTYYLKELEENKKMIEETELNITKKNLTEDANEFYELKNLRRIQHETEKLIPNLNGKARQIIKDIEENVDDIDDSSKEVIADAKKVVEA